MGGSLAKRGTLDLRGGDRLTPRSAIPVDSSLHVQWFVLIGDEGEYWYIPYVQNLNSHLEAEYWAGVVETTFTFQDKPYSVNFNRMVQKNSDTGKERPVCRTLKMIPNTASPSLIRKLGWTVIHTEEEAMDEDD